MTTINPSELLAKAKKTMPSVRCTDPAFVWVGPASTNVQATWRKWGWVKPGGWEIPAKKKRTKSDGR